MDTSKISVSDLSKKMPALIFVYSRPCSPCDKNIPYWNKIAKILIGRAATYGIFLSDLTEAYNFSEKAKLTFPVYVPSDIEQFIEKMKIKFNLPQTILYYKDKVYFTQLGKLDGDDTVFINMIEMEISSNFYTSTWKPTLRFTGSKPKKTACISG